MRVIPLGTEYHVTQRTQNNWRAVGLGATRDEAIKNCLKEVVKAESNPSDDDDHE